MQDKSSAQALLENAYALKSPADNVAYYRAMAEAYDGDFAVNLGWAYPHSIALAYQRQALPTDLPVADIGCGTGFVAAELRLAPDQIDGMDISPDMLAIAKTKSLYRALYEVDLTGPLDAIAQTYGAVLSAGTFTHGHLGPAPLENLLQIARSGALFVIGVNQQHFAAQGFAQTLAALHTAGRISAYQTEEILMYSIPGHVHSEDRALILTFRKA